MKSCGMTTEVSREKKGAIKDCSDSIYDLLSTSATVFFSLYIYNLAIVLNWFKRLYHLKYLDLNNT